MVIAVCHHRLLVNCGLSVTQGLKKFCLILVQTACLDLQKLNLYCCFFFIFPPLVLQLYEVFTFLAERGGVAQIHAENGEIIAKVTIKVFIL